MGVWLYTPAGLSLTKPPLKSLRTIRCTVSSFQGGLSGAHAALLCAGCREELGAPEPLAEVEGDGRVTATAGKLTNGPMDQLACSCATTSPARWMDGWGTTAWNELLSQGTGGWVQAQEWVLQC